MSAAADVILLDSSPAQPVSHTPAPATYDPEKLFGISPCEPSPPPVLSPSELFRPPSRSRFFNADNQSPRRSNVRGKKAQSEKAARSGNPDVEEKETITPNKPKQRRAKATSEVLENSTSNQKKETASKKPRATKAKSAEGPKKRGRPSNKTAVNNKTLSGRVAKAGNAQTKETDEKSKRPSTPESLSGETSAKDPIDWAKEGLQLEAATKRRFDWTPTKDTMARAVETDKMEGVDDSTSNSFGSLLADYNFSGGSSLPRNNSGAPGDGAITKRRRIDLVDSRLNPESRQRSLDDDKPSTEEEQSSKTLEPKKRRQRQPKKLTTITARVTAQYNTDLTPSSGLSTASAKDSTPVQSKSTKAKGKGKSMPQEPEFIVLSPEAAAKSLDDQDLVFGTCSQLQREDSPTLLKETQAAILESEKSIAAASTSSIARDSCFKASSTATVSRFKTPRNLWSVGARDSEGSLAQVEVVDLSESPALPKMPSTSSKKAKAVPKEKPRAEPHVIPDVSSHNEVSEPKKTSPLDKEPSPVASKGTNTEKSGSQETAQHVEPLPEMPRYAGFTDAELSKQVAAFGFKAVRNRKKMIELLRKCWESKHVTSVSVDSKKQDNEPPQSKTELPPSQSQPQSQSTGKRTRKDASTSQATTKVRKTQPSKPSKCTTRSKNEPSASPLKSGTKQAPSQPDKAQAASSIRSFADIEEIQDSEDEVVPSPSRLLARYAHPIPEERQSLPMSPTPSTPIRSTARSLARPSATPQETKSNSPPDLASQITKAVRAQAQSRASSAPHSHLTWHEKMLIYDPIILEDFTGWLNTEGLALVAENREVGAGLVRQWCEHRSICCCYR